MMGWRGERHDMAGLREENAEDRQEWRRLIKVASRDIGGEEEG